MSAESIVYISGSRGETQSGAPHTADLRLTGLCQLRCDWCWGPEHFKKGDVTPEEWGKTIGRLATAGTKQLVFSGGEPLLSKALRPGIQAAKDNDLRVTLSTNGILLGKNGDILRSVDDLGIPIDGSTPEVNDAMRTRSVKHDAWKRAVEAIRLAQSMKQEGETDVAITSRTVIAKPNLHDVPRIPEALEASGVDLSDLRMKFYQVEPFGPHVAHIDFDHSWAVTADEAKEAADLTRANYPSANITLQLYENTVGRYFLVDPDGFASGTDEDKSGNPVEIAYGNLVHDFDATIDTYQQHQESLV